MVLDVNPLPLPASRSFADVAAALSALPAGCAPIGLVSDVHGCPSELTAALTLLAALGIPRQRVICLGDLVDYGHEPGAVIRLAQTLMRVVPGNHDMDAVESGTIIGRDVQVADVIWLETVCEGEWFHRTTLENLFGGHPVSDRPSVPSVPSVVLIHDSPDAMHSGPGTGQRIKRGSHALEAFRVMTREDVDLCIVGHTHMPAIFVTPDRRTSTRVVVEHDVAVTINPAERTLIVVGSVARPRGAAERPHAGVLTPWWYSHLAITG